MKYIPLLLVVSLIPVLKDGAAPEIRNEPLVVTTWFLDIASDAELQPPIDEVVSSTEIGHCDPGSWVVTFYSPDHWRCTRDGGCCCPGFDCGVE